MEKERADLLKYIKCSLNQINTTNRMEEIHEFEIYLKDYVKRYVDSNKKRIKNLQEEKKEGS